MPVYENTAADGGASNTATGETDAYEQPFSESRPPSQPRSECLYFEPQLCLSPPVISDNTSGTNTDEAGFRKLDSRTLQISSIRKIVIYLGFVTAFIILSIGASVAAIVLASTMQPDSATFTNETSKSCAQNFDYLMDAVATLRLEIRQYEKNRSQEFRKSLELYDWYQAENRRWYKIFEAKVKYSQARENCEALGARLASSGIRDQEIKRDVAKNLLGNDKSFVWIGLEDLQKRYTWVWSDGVESSQNNTEWRDGAPRIDAGNQRCGFLVVSNQWTINHRECGRTLSYLCETKTAI